MKGDVIISRETHHVITNPTGGRNEFSEMGIYS